MPPGLPQKYEVLIDAVTRELLYRRNRVLYADGFGEVLQSDAAAGDQREAPRSVAHRIDRRRRADPLGVPACQPISSLAVSRRCSATRRRCSSATGRLRGNNVHVFRGAPGVEGAQGTLQPDGWHFEFSFNTADAAETHLFFLSNFLHDFFYDLGFRRSRRATSRRAIFGRGGLEGDASPPWPAPSGRNNATFEPNPDGQRRS